MILPVGWSTTVIFVPIVSVPGPSLSKATAPGAASGTLKQPSLFFLTKANVVTADGGVLSLALL